MSISTATSTTSGLLTSTDWQKFNAKIDSVQTSDRISGNGTSGSPLDIAAQGASNGDVLTFDGSVWLPAALPSASDDWTTSGNAGTTAGTDFVGTTDSQALDLRSNNNVVLRLNPNGSIQLGDGGDARGDDAVDLSNSRAAGSQVASGAYSVLLGGSRNIASGDYAAVLGGNGNVASGSQSVVIGAEQLTLSGADAIGFKGGASGAPMEVADSDVAVFANADMWLANNNGNASSLKFFEPHSTTGAFPNGANFTAFVAQDQTTDITYTLPAEQGANGTVLTNDGMGELSWTSVSGGGGWQLDGNGGTTAGTDFLGTTDSVSLDLRSNDVIYFRLNPNGSLQRREGGDPRGDSAVDLQLIGSDSHVASGRVSFIGGGDSNSVSAERASVVNGRRNVASERLSTVVGGSFNTADGIASGILAGYYNVTSTNDAVVLGGIRDTASGGQSIVGAGLDNHASGQFAGILAGRENKASGDYAGIVTGYRDTASGTLSVVVGGRENHASGSDAGRLCRSIECCIGNLLRCCWGLGACRIRRQCCCCWR